MNFLKQNWFKLALLIILVVFGYYYFSIVLPSRNLQDKITECQKLGEEKRKNEIAEANESINFFNPKYKYSEELNICIYRNGYVFGVGGKPYVNNYIIDLYTNKIIYESSTGDSPEITENFVKKEEELFGK